MANLITANYDDMGNQVVDPNALGANTSVGGHKAQHAVIELPQANPLQFKKWRVALGKVRNNTAQAKLLLIGDSTSNGSGASGATGYNPNSREKNRTVKLSALLSASYINANSHGVMGVGNLSGPGYASFDPRFVADAAWPSLVLNNMLGGTAWRNNTANTILAFTPIGSVDTFVIYYAKSATQGTFNVDIGGAGTILVTATAGSPSVGTQVITGTLGTNTLNITRQSTSAIVLGVRAYNSAAASVEVIQAGNSGLTTSFAVGNANPWDTLSMIPVVAPDLTIISLGINDWPLTLPVTTSMSNIQQIITAAKQTGDVLLTLPPPSAISAASRATQQAYITASIALAVTNNIDIVDMWSRFVSQEEANTLGFYADTLHPNGVGYSDWAYAEFSKLSSL